MATKSSKKKSVKKPAAKHKAKPSAKKPAPKKKPVAKKPAAKKAAPKKPSKAPAKKPAAKKPEPKKLLAKGKVAPAPAKGEKGKAAKIDPKAAGKAGKNGAKADLFAPAPERDINQFIADKTRELVKLAKDQGYLTFDDLEENLPSNVHDADVIDKIITRLREVEIELIEQSDVDSDKAPRKEEEKTEKDE
ncbi:MAG: RNA polymerase sigma factor region1.1 domain-containing protein, partial [Chthoniobacterales bacterium]